VNAYDDGLSTGELRALLPDMLGPSDFRKNLTQLVNPHSTEQYALQHLLDYRFSKDFSTTDIHAFEDFAATGAGWLPEPLSGLFVHLQPRLRKIVIDYLGRFMEYRRQSGVAFNYPDSSLGNLVFAGAYLDTNHDFNASVHKISSMCSPRAEVVNVTRGENRNLVALKENGELLCREASIVGPQTPTPIREFFLMERPIESGIIQELADLTVEQKSKRLRGLHCDVQLSPECEDALRRADIIIYGPGTQFSSLLPSYCTVGITDAIATSSARLKLFVCNLDSDNDIQSLSASDLVDKALEVLGDQDNVQQLVTHIFYNAPSEFRRSGVKPGRIADSVYKSAVVIKGRFESSAKSTTHCGYSVVRRGLSFIEDSRQGLAGELDIYLDLLDRSSTVDSVLQEFVDVPWDEQFNHVTLRLNRAASSDIRLPPYARVVSAEYEGLFTEVEALLDWLSHGESQYLVTITGDGHYRLSDILVGVQFLRSGGFGVVLGSRTQSRRQFHFALDSAYGEHKSLRFFSWLGAFLFTAVVGVRCGVIFSDPFTGFRIYKRTRLDGTFARAMMARVPTSAARIMRLLIQHSVEIAEIPVAYRTFRGFIDVKWRIHRGLRNVFGVLF
jgi:2-phospho-L-lactate transferase/gluconeogenesis factor (CofD/UPF0052 family)